MLASLLLESLLAFGVVVALALAARFFYTQEKPSAVVISNNASVQQPSLDLPAQTAETGEELRYNPARTSAYVTSAFASVMSSAKSDAAVLDQLTYGSLVDLGGWDSGRKFVKIKAAPGVSGFISIKELSYVDPASQMQRAAGEMTTAETWKMRLRSHLSSNSASTFDHALDVDASEEGLTSKKSLSEFFEILRQNPSKSVFNNAQASISYTFLARDLDGKDILIYPRLPQFISKIKSQSPSPGTLFEAGMTGSGQGILGSDPSQPLKLKLTKEPLGLIARPQQELSNVGLSTLNVLCMELNCSLRFDALPSPGTTGLSALVMGQVERVKPTMVMEERDSGEVLVGFLDIDGDRQYESAIYIAQRFADILTPATVYVAENHEGSWRLKYIKDNDVGRDNPRVSLEPGTHPMPVNVRLYNEGGFAIAYTLDGAEPSCQSAIQKKTIVREAEIFIDQSTTIKAKTCGGGLKSSPLMTFNYDVKK